MTYDGRRFRGDQTEEILDDLGPAGVAPGKRTLTQGLASAHAAGDDDDALRLPVIQMALVDGAPRPGGGGGDHLLDAALRPDLHTGSGRPLDAGVRAGMERSFGADFGAVRVHEGPHVADAGALAYARGADLHFAPGQYAPESDRGRELIGHELAHVVQQAQGRVGATAQAKGAQLNDDASLEREADELGSRAARGEPVAAPGATPVIAADASRGVMQRYAWVGGTQLTRASPGLTAPQLAMVTDTQVREYNDNAEFVSHAGGATDYLGNLPDGTWVRFNPTGINLLGENHTLLRLEVVMPAVGSTNFIYEPFSNDDLSGSPSMRAAYNTENDARFTSMGVGAGAADRRAHGAESLYPKIGWTMTLAQPFFNGSQPLTGLQLPNYVGQPIQRYLKIAWGFSADNVTWVAAEQAAGRPVPPQRLQLAALHPTLAPHLDAFITALPVDGYLGDALTPPARAPLLPHLASFAREIIDVMMEMAVADPNSGLNARERRRFGRRQATTREARDTFSEWRDNEFEEAVRDATARGVRYAGMGRLHLDNLIANGLTGTQHPFDMSGRDLTRFRTATAARAAAAVPP